MTGRIAAIVLSAGYSSRMGEFKPLLPLGDRTVLEGAIGLFQDGGIDDIRVVIGHRAGDLAPLIENCQARPVVNKRYKDGMFSSVVTGVRDLDKDIEAFFLLPVDIPLVRAGTIKELLREHVTCGSHILYPRFLGERGHPPLIPCCYREDILNWNGTGGLKSCLSKYEAVAADVDVIDELMLLDMDTPEDYERLQAFWHRREIPTRRECEAILNKYAAGERLVGHCREVEKLSRFLAEKLNNVYGKLDPELVSAAALLHDIAKGRPGHAEEGALLLREMGYPRVADIVACHMDLIANEDDAITEKEIIYLADKLILREQRVPIGVRFKSRLECLANDGEILKAVEVRLKNALSIQKRVEALLGRPLNELLEDK